MLDSLSDISWVQKATFSFTEGMCHSSTHPGALLHVTQFYQAFLVLVPVLQAANTGVRRSGYEASIGTYLGTMKK